MDDITREYEDMLTQRIEVIGGIIIPKQRTISEVKQLSSCITDYHTAFQERVRVSDIVD
ncbi:hypothetical protein HN747_00775 [archaeon]|jgi:hypothetical protein|nr:hypothetical protein [archaeon]